MVVNDGSKDGTLDQIRDFQSKYPEINLKIYNHKKSTGIGFIFYKYSRKVKGDYCRMVMGDDVDHIKTHKNILRFIHKYDIIIPIYNIFYDFMIFFGIFGTSTQDARNYSKREMQNIYIKFQNDKTTFNNNIFDGFGNIMD